MVDEVMEEAEPGEANHLISHIIGGVYISDYIGAKTFDGITVNVHHDCEITRDFQVPLLSKKPNSSSDRTGAKVNPKNLELLHVILTSTFENNGSVLVHCRGGVERSPLTVATWLVAQGHSKDLDEAYKFLMEKREVVQDRRYWL